VTADDLRAIGTWVDWRGNPPKVTIPAATRDALADLIDAARGLLEALEPINPMVLGTGACAAYDYTSHLLAALDQEPPT
jgi:hypothetical protein